MHQASINRRKSNPTFKWQFTGLTRHLKARKREYFISLQLILFDIITDSQAIQRTFINYKSTTTTKTIKGSNLISFQIRTNTSAHSSYLTLEEKNTCKQGNNITSALIIKGQVINKQSLAHHGVTAHLHLFQFLFETWKINKNRLPSNFNCIFKIINKK